MMDRHAACSSTDIDWYALSAERAMAPAIPPAVS